MGLDDRFEGIADWLQRVAFVGASLEELVEGLCTRLRDAGIRTFGRLRYSWVCRLYRAVCIARRQGRRGRTLLPRCYGVLRDTATIGVHEAGHRRVLPYQHACDGGQTHCDGAVFRFGTDGNLLGAHLRSIGSERRSCAAMSSGSAVHCFTATCADQRNSACDCHPKTTLPL